MLVHMLMLMLMVVKVHVVYMVHMVLLDLRGDAVWIIHHPLYQQELKQNLPMLSHHINDHQDE
jgi:hypothetical protein